MTGEGDYNDDEDEKGEGGRRRGNERKRGRVDIVEGVGGKEGVEGVGVGAINLYLVVFGDGIISVSLKKSLPLQSPLRRDWSAKPGDGRSVGICFSFTLNR